MPLALKFCDIWHDCETLQKTFFDSALSTPHVRTWTVQEVPAQVPLTVGNSTLLQRVMERQPKSKTCEDHPLSVTNPLQTATKQILDCTTSSSAWHFAVSAGVKCICRALASDSRSVGFAWSQECLLVDGCGRSQVTGCIQMPGCSPEAHTV